MAISVGDAVLKLGVDTKDMDRGLKGLKGTIQKHNKAIGMAMTAVGGAILAAGVLSIKTFAAMGDEVQKMALRTGFGTEALSELRHAAELSGTSISSLEKASKTLSGAILDAGYGLETYTRAFDQIGLSYEELEKLSPEDQFIAVMEALAGVEDESKRAALAADLFGRAGTQLLPMMADGVEGLSAMRQEAHDLGIVFDQEAADKAAGFQDAMTRLGESVSGVKMVIAEQLIPALMPLIEKIKNIISGISAWMKEHPGLTQVIVLATMALGALLVVLGPLLIFLPQITAAYAIMRGFMLTKLIPSIAATTAALWAKVAALYAAMVAMGPAGWAMAAASMALIATGLVFIIKKAKEATSAFTGEVDQYTPAAREADDITRKWSDGLSELEIVTRRISDAESRLSGVRKKLTEQTTQIDRRQIDLIASSADYIKIQDLMARANLGSIESAEELVDILLVKINLTKEEITFLEQYIGKIEKANEAEKERQKELEETTKLLEEQAEAQEKATEALAEAHEKAIETVEDVIEALQYERSEAGRLRITIDDVTRALISMDKTTNYIASTLVSLGDESGNVLAVLDAFGLEALSVAVELGVMSDALADYTDEALLSAGATQEYIDKLREMYGIKPPGAEVPGEQKAAIEKYTKIGAAGGYAWGQSPEWIAAKGAESEAVARWKAAEPGSLEQAAAWADIKVAAYEAILAERAALATAGGISGLYDDINKATQTAIEYWKGIEPEELRKPEELGETEFPGWQFMQHGGIAMRPMPAIIAERKPEAVIPLDRLEGMMGGRRVNIYVELDGRTIAKAIGQPLVDEIRLRGVHV